MFYDQPAQEVRVLFLFLVQINMYKLNSRHQKGPAVYSNTLALQWGHVIPSARIFSAQMQQHTPTFWHPTKVALGKLSKQTQHGSSCSSAALASGLIRTTSEKPFSLCSLVTRMRSTSIGAGKTMRRFLKAARRERGGIISFSTVESAIEWLDWE